MAFQEDLQLGHKAQDYIVREFSLEFPGIKSIGGNVKEYDLVCGEYRAEVKCDLMSEVHKNVAIEYLYSGRPSGISATNAYDWVHIYKLDNDWVYARIRVPNLKAFLKTNEAYFRKTKGGDGKKSMLVLIPCEEFANNFTYKKITQDQT